MANPNKIELRKEFLEKRNRLASDVRTRNSAAIRQHIERHALWTNAATVAIYISFGSEVDTHLLIQEALRQKKRIVVPWIHPDKKEMAFCELKKWDDLVPGFYKNILEPSPSLRATVEPADIHLALVPVVAFDRRGNRLGMGGGYYDRLLPKMIHATCVGLAYEVQMSPTSLPVETHDIGLQSVVTEQEWIKIS
jgi:5-formyltetrahydrofolate cyclo-ligase